jgi:hypothetical protein
MFSSNTVNEGKKISRAHSAGETHGKAYHPSLSQIGELITQRKAALQDLKESNRQRLGDNVSEDVDDGVDVRFF